MLLLWRHIASAILTADHIDYWVRRYAIEYCLGRHPSGFAPSENAVLPVVERLRP